MSAASLIFLHLELKDKEEERLTVCGGGHAKTLHAHLEREDIARDDPGYRAPNGAEEEEEDTDERDAGLLRGDVEHDDVAERVLRNGGHGQCGILRTANFF